MTTSPVMSVTDELVAELEAVAHTGKGAFMIECAEVHALLTERAELLRDAKNYRTMRDGEGWPAVFNSSDAPEPLRGTDLDAAMQSEAKP